MIAAPIQLDACEEFARSILYPKYFDNHVFSYIQLMQFDSVNNFDGGEEFKKGRRVISIGCCKYLNNDKSIHAFGCRIAQRQNDRFNEKNGRIPKPLEEARHYIGFYKGVAGRIHGISCTYHRLSIVHEPEDGEEAHGHIQLFELKNIDKHLQKIERTQIAVDIFRTLIGPWRHVCAEDRSIKSTLKRLVVDEMIPSA